MNPESVLKRFAQKYNAEGVFIYKRSASAEGHVESIAQWTAVKVSERDRDRVRNALEQGIAAAPAKSGPAVKCYYQGPWCIAFTGDFVSSDMDSNVLEALEAWFELLLPGTTPKDQPETLMEAASEIVACIQRTDALDLMLQTCIQNIPTADTGWVFIYDFELECLVVKAAVGFRNASYVKSKLKLWEGLSGKVFATGSPSRVNGIDNVKEAMGNMSGANLQHYFDAAIHGDYPKGLMSAPLSDQNGRIGVVTVDNFTIDTTFEETDLSTLKAFSDLMSVVIGHSQSFKRVWNKNEELSHSYERVNEEKQKLLSAIKSYKHLVNIVAQGGDSQQILTGIYRVINSPMIVYDNLLSPLSRCPDDFDIKLPNSFLRLPEMRNLERRQSEDSLISVQLDDESIYVTPILGTDQIIGYLCARVSKVTPLDYVYRSVLSFGAKVIALEIMKQDAIKESKLLAIGRVADELLLGNIDSNLMQQAQFLGFTEDSSYVCCILRGKDQHGKTGTSVGRGIHIFEGFFDNRNIFYVKIPSQEGTSVFIIDLGSRTYDEQLKLVHEMMSIGFEKEDIELTIGRPYQGIGEISKSYEEAKSCLDLYDSFQVEDSPLYFGELGVLRFFLRTDRREMFNYVTDVLQPVLDVDKQSGSTTLISTLLAYIKYDRSLKKAADVLHIHHNTLYYRTRRIEEILGYSLQDSENWLNVKLACQIYRLLMN